MESIPKNTTAPDPSGAHGRSIFSSTPSPKPPTCSSTSLLSPLARGAARSFRFGSCKVPVKSALNLL